MRPEILMATLPGIHSIAEKTPDFFYPGEIDPRAEPFHLKQPRASNN
jgi:hypothetical protein